MLQVGDLTSDALRPGKISHQYMQSLLTGSNATVGTDTPLVATDKAPAWHVCDPIQTCKRTQ